MHRYKTPDLSISSDVVCLLIVIKSLLKCARIDTVIEIFFQVNRKCARRLSDYTYNHVAYVHCTRRTNDYNEALWLYMGMLQF